MNIMTAEIEKGRRMIPFKLVNVNPKGHKTGDCSTRAIVGTLGISYEEALDLQCKYAKKFCYGITCKETTERVLKEFGYVKMKQPRKPNGRKYSVNEMDLVLTKKQMEEGVLLSVANHDTCIKNGMIEDLWDCGNKKVGNYYVKI